MFRDQSAGMCGGRDGMGVRTVSGVTVGNFSLCQTYELSTYYASFCSGRFADYPIGQYLTELSGKVRLLLCIAGLCCLTGLYGHGNDHAFGKLDAGQQAECLHCTQKRTDGSPVPMPLRCEVGNGQVALVGLQHVVLLS